MATETHTDLMMRIEVMTPSSTKPQVRWAFPVNLTQALAVYQSEIKKQYTRKVDLYGRVASWSRT